MADSSRIFPSILAPSEDARVGLSADPVKRRRQLEALERGAQARAATLRARIVELGTSEDQGGDRSEDPIEDRSEDRGEDPPVRTAGVIVAGSYGDLPAPTAEPDPDPEPELEPEGEETPPEPSAAAPAASRPRGAKLAAAALGVRPQR